LVHSSARINPAGDRPLDRRLLITTLRIWAHPPRSDCRPCAGAHLLTPTPGRARVARGDTMRVRWRRGSPTATTTRSTPEHTQQW